jgi:hypothetical protein
MNVLFELNNSTLYKINYLKTLSDLRPSFASIRNKVAVCSLGVDTCAPTQRLRKVLGPERNDITGEWRRLQMTSFMIYIPHQILFG